MAEPATGGGERKGSTMRVDGLGRMAAGGGNAARQAAPGSGFRIADAYGFEPARGASPLRAAPSLDALIALQAMTESPRERRKRAVVRGRGLLEALDGLKLALLDGRTERGALSALVERLAERREPTGDPGLDDALDAIELRVQVEMAKRGA